jgi:hypothetical protein
MGGSRGVVDVAGPCVYAFEYLWGVDARGAEAVVNIPAIRAFTMAAEISLRGTAPREGSTLDLSSDGSRSGVLEQRSLWS